MPKMEPRRSPGVFVSAAFGLYEFDDSGLAASSGESASRWLAGWNGQAGAPAEDVSLAWSADRAAVVVCTSAQFAGTAEREELRRRAALDPLGGDTLPVPLKPGSPREVWQEMDRIVSDNDLWSEIPGMRSGWPSGEAADCGGFAIGYCDLGDLAVFIAAVGVTLAGFKVRAVSDWNAYDIDASKTFPLSDLEGARMLS